MVLCGRQVCSHLDQLSADLEAAAHPALDDLTAKVCGPGRPLGMRSRPARCGYWLTAGLLRVSAEHVSGMSGALCEYTWTVMGEPCLSG